MTFMRAKPRTNVEQMVLRGCVDRERIADDDGPLYKLDETSMTELATLVDAVCHF